MNSEGISLFKAVFEEGTREEQMPGNRDYRSIMVKKVKIESVYQVGNKKKFRLADPDAEGKFVEVDLEITAIRYEPVGDRWAIVIYATRNEYESALIVRFDVHNCRMFLDADKIWGITIMEDVRDVK